MKTYSVMISLEFLLFEGLEGPIDVSDEDTTIVSSVGDEESTSIANTKPSSVAIKDCCKYAL